MMKEERIVRYTAAEIDDMIARGEDKTDWDYVRSLTDEEVEASIDFKDEGVFDYSFAYPRLPSFGPKQQLTVRFDRDIVDWFKSQGSGYQTKMNAVLRSYVEAQRGKPGRVERHRESFQMEVALTAKQETLVRKMLARGHYENAGEVIGEALRLFEARETHLAWLQEQVAIAEAQFERGEVFDLTAELMEQLGEEAEEDARKGKPIRDAVLP